MPTIIPVYRYWQSTAVKLARVMHSLSSLMICGSYSYPEHIAAAAADTTHAMADSARPQDVRGAVSRRVVPLALSDDDEDDSSSTLAFGFVDYTAAASLDAAGSPPASHAARVRVPA